MNNIYVDELPKKCKGCLLHNEDNGWCQVLICYTDDVPTDCPLKPLTDRLAEERKKVVELFKNMSTINNTTMDIVGKFYTIPDYLLNQIERGE